MKVHEGRRDYKCESCSKSFKEAGTMKKHILRIHSVHGGKPTVQGNKNSKCESCGKSFFDASTLKRHHRRKH